MPDHGRANARVKRPGIAGSIAVAGTSDAGHCDYRLPERETPNPCARKRSGRLLEQAARRTNADRLPDGCDQVAIIAGAATAHGVTPCGVQAGSIAIIVPFAYREAASRISFSPEICCSA